MSHSSAPERASGAVITEWRPDCWIVYQRQLTLRRQGFDELRVMLISVGQAGDVRHRVDADSRQLFRQRFAMVDNIMRTGFAYPFLAFRARRGADHRQSGEFAGQLRQDGAHAACGADNQQRIPFVAALDRKSVV